MGNRFRSNHPMVIATSRIGCDVLYSIEDVAHFIFTEGVTGDIHMADSEGRAFLTTNGVFIDFVWSEDYRKELLELIGNRQKMVIDYIEKLFSPPSKAAHRVSFAAEDPGIDENDSDDGDDEREVFRNYLD